MPLVAPSVRVTLNGTLGQGEVFTTGYWLQGTLPANQAAADAATATLTSSTAWNNSIANLTGLLSPDGSYTSARFYWYAAAGAPAAFITQIALAAAPGTGGRTVPYQTCLVVSLRSALLTRSGRGRMYLPANGASLTNNQYTSATCSSALTAVRQNANAAIAALLTGTPAMIIQSTRSAATTPVTKLIADSRPDIQRRRAQKETVLFTSTLPFP